DAAGLLVHALEARHHRDLAALLEPADELGAVDLLDARAGMGVVGVDRQLPSLPRARVDAHALEHHGREAGSPLFAAAPHRVVLARIVQRRRLAAPADELVSLARHGGDDDGHVVAGIDLALDVPRHVADVLDVGDRGAAELHDEAGHG